MVLVGSLLHLRHLEASIPNRKPCTCDIERSPVEMTEAWSCLTTPYITFRAAVLPRGPYSPYAPWYRYLHREVRDPCAIASGRRR
ncbi:hypothetical protein BD310DRAFT_922003 [Dichomitus squalens]|uniref:Uncharacterized protein n=1 Tax=Dichomitus squalens TaxID=114155 RepID=A0A4Q9Q190_9APHY|nr:hypothetical protein BD310DRAFT_922003 [Dichomitus squalens]